MDESSALRRKKNSLTLDLTNSRVGKKAYCDQAAAAVGGSGGLGGNTATPTGGQCTLDSLQLSSPECGGLLKLTTAELERFLLQPNAPLLASPATPLLFLKPTNEEQEAYARGFMDALIEIRRKQLNSFSGIVCLDGSGTGPGVTPSLVTLTPVSPYAPMSSDAITSGSLCSQLLPVNLTNSASRNGSSTASTGTPTQQSDPPEPVVQWSDPPEPVAHRWSNPSDQMHESSSRSSSQTDPSGNTPPQSPIDMSDQERIKLERKREKNRRAAQKCRTRKLERIARLEHRTKQLREQNARLAQESADVCEQLVRLRSQIAEHFRNGCFLTHESDDA